MLPNKNNYITFTQRERHRMVDDTVRASLDALHIPQVVRRLGKDAAMLTSLLSDVTVPNVHHGVMHFTADCFEKTPILPVDSDEVLQWPAVQVDMHSRQKQSIRDAYGDNNAQWLIDGLRDDDNVQPPYLYGIESLNQKRAAAYVASINSERETSEGTFVVWSAPVVLIDGRRKIHRAPPTMLHELMHVEQFHLYPIITPTDSEGDMNWERELESYHVESQVMYGYYEAGQRQLLLAQTGTGVDATNALRIDAIRRKNMTDPNDPYWPTAAMKRIIRQKQLLDLP